MTTSSKHEDKQDNISVENDSIPNKPNLKGDWSNFFLLLLLYTMQGIPLGIIRTIPILLQTNKTVTYQDQAYFSIVGWPFTLKLLWAPLVDVFYITKIGRRKSWLIPVQLLIGIGFLYLANNIDELLPETERPNILKIVFIFFVIKLLAATQDIVVDGWALTMLKRNNVGYASICSSTGTLAGIMIGFTLPVLLTSKDSNKYLWISPTNGQLITMKSLFYTWSVMYISITLAIGIFKKEKNHKLEENHVKLNIFQNYLLLWDILKLNGVQILAISLFTSKFGFAYDYGLTTLKLIDAGITKEDITIIHSIITGVVMILPLVIAKYTSGSKSMKVYTNSICIRLLWGIPIFMLVYYTPSLINNNGIKHIPIYYYVALTLIISINSILGSIMDISTTAFFSQISDPRFGGTYMTLLNTLSNLGHVCVNYISFSVVDLITFKKCSLDPMNNCSTLDLRNMCEINNGNCIITVDGYFIEIVLCFILGFIWYCIFKNILKNLQAKKSSYWLIDIKQPIDKNNENAYSMVVM